MPPLDYDTEGAPGGVPTDYEAERRVVGACLLDSDAIDDAMAVVRPEHFFSNRHRNIYLAVCDMRMANEPINTQTIIRKLGEMAPTGADFQRKAKSLLDEIGGSVAVVDTIEGVLPEEATFWAERVRKKQGERKLLEFAEHAREVALSGPKDLAKVRGQLEEMLAKSGKDDQDADTATLADDSGSLHRRISRYIDDPTGITGIVTGWSAFDYAIDGMQGGNLMTLYAPSGRFKSFTVANIIHKVAEQGVGVLWFTTEMPRIQVQERMLGLEVGINFRWRRKDGTIASFRDDIETGMKFLATYPVYYNDRSSPDVNYIRSEVSRRARWNNVKVVVVDLVDEVEHHRFKEDTVAQQRAIMKAMKHIAKQNNVFVIAVSHISKQEKHLRNQADYDAEDMIGSSAKKQESDIAVSVNVVQFDVENDRWVGMSREAIDLAKHNIGRLTLMLAITKNRHGDEPRLIFEIDLNKGGRMYPRNSGPSWRQTQFDEYGD